MKPPDAEEKAGNVDEAVPTDFDGAEVEKDGVEVMNPHEIVEGRGVFITCGVNDVASLSS